MTRQLTTATLLALSLAIGAGAHAQDRRGGRGRGAEAGPHVPTVLDRDTEFVAGSKVELATVTPVQADNLAMLGMVWGFLKYHHSAAADGQIHWDFELFRVLPVVMAAGDRAAAQAALAAWVERLGKSDKCARCAPVVMGVAVKPNIAWIKDQALLGAPLSRALQSAYDNRAGADSQFYVAIPASPAPGTPAFFREPAYGSLPKPLDPGYRLLGLFRYWNIIEYWYPYRELIGEDWHAVLKDEIPKFVAASTWDAYRLEMLSTITRLHDTHANLWNGLDIRPPRGSCSVAVDARFVEGKLTITAFKGVGIAQSGLRIGDAVVAVEGRPVDSLLVDWLPFYAASNRVAQLRDIAGTWSRGECGAVALTLQRGGERVPLGVERVTSRPLAPVAHDRSGPAFQRLSPEIAYLKLSAAKAADLVNYMSLLSGTKGLVIDARNAPLEAGFVSAWAPHLANVNEEFAAATRGELGNPGTFTWVDNDVIRPIYPFYDGTVVVLVDEVTQSTGEYAAMAFRATGAKVVGSTTAGADGGVSPIPLPGGLVTAISGTGVFYANKKPTQRIGIVPDVVAAPTMAGIAAGRDEVLEAAIKQILGNDVDEARLKAMAGRQ